MTNKIVVIDYGIGNVFSVCNALQEIGADPVLTGDLAAIEAADRVILPGVGAFSRAMDALNGAGLSDSIRKFASSGRPFLGICIGMQVLMEQSTEKGTHAGLGLIEGSVDLIPSSSEAGERILVPHISWAQVQRGERTPDAAWDGSLLGRQTDMNDYFYFVHSYAAKPTHDENLLAEIQYGGNQITAAVRKDNVTGLQFHPERSGAAGLNLLRNFLEL